MLKHIRNLAIIAVVLAIGVAFWITRPDEAQVPMDEMVGVDPVLGDPRPQMVPTVDIAEVARWSEDQKPAAAAGLTVARFADGLDHPRNLYTMPNGDILVAETNSPPRENGGIQGWVMKHLLGRAGADTPSANRITLLRDSDGDGEVDLRSTFLKGLNSPFGMAVIGDKFYVADTDALLVFPYRPDATEISAKGRKLYGLNAMAPNTHWTRNLAVSPDQKKLYIAVGSNSNIGDNGLDSERGRAMVIEYDLTTGKAIPLATGMRNPVGLAFYPGSDILWAVVNERDMLGSDLVPDYLAEVEFGADYGWPWHYWGGYTDPRVKPARPEKRQYERRPDYSLGPHVAALGLVFADRTRLGGSFANGAFVARHGSWNREPPSGYDVIFVPFRNARPVGKQIEILSGFLDQNGDAHGRPTMLAADKTGALLVSDDVGNVIWRVTPDASAPAASGSVR
ncbi:PQQ-dependent sugar dehydrogenase [Novosphingopyxis sp.]|uniref:PQQ-dependent sugar dehydrogenase n=1 Tax=Novosphingopyxis sp. TaxID=2709690 RepID=UPI003B597DA2